MSFQEQDTEVKVLNFDEIVNDTTQTFKPHGDFWGSSRIRAVFCGPSNCGKTNALLTLLVHPNGLRYENVYIFSKTLNQPKYEWLEKLLKSIPGIKFFKFSENDEVISADDILSNSIMIFDDIALEKQDRVKAFFCMVRHKGVDIIYVCQTYPSIPKQLIRDNLNMLVIFCQDEMNMKHIYNNHVNTDMEYKEFKDLCHSCWKDSKHNFLVINKQCDLEKGRYRKNFDSFFVDKKGEGVKETQSSKDNQSVNNNEKMERADVLKEIAGYRDSIRRKHLALKLGKEAAESAIQQNLKPLTEPLGKIAENLTVNSRKRLLIDETQNVDTPVSKKKKKKNKKNKNNSLSTIQNNSELTSANYDNSSMFRTVTDKPIVEESVEMDLTPFQNDNNTIQQPSTSSFQSSTPIRNNKNYLKANDYLEILKTEDNTSLDLKTGVRLLQIGTYIGNTPVTFDDEHVTVKDKKYTLTKGLTDLLFKKTLSPYIKKTDQDKRDYIEIIKTTNAHKKSYKANEALRNDGTQKMEIIKEFLKEYGQNLNDSGNKKLNKSNKKSNKSGKGLLPRYMLSRNVPIDYVHWDDPNELVDRLRLLVAEREAGHTGHENEIHSIIEELREARIIY